MAKRQKEMARQEKQREKAAKRVQRAVARLNPTPEPEEGALGVDGLPAPEAPVESAVLPAV